MKNHNLEIKNQETALEKKQGTPATELIEDDVLIYDGHGNLVSDNWQDVTPLHIQMDFSGKRKERNLSPEESI